MQRRAVEAGLIKLEHALALAARGLRVFPLTPGAKAPPLIRGFPEAATVEDAQIRQWWTAWPDANIGVAADGLTILDVDVAKGGNDSFALLDLTEGVPASLTVRTPSGGRHVYLRGETRNGVDVLGRGLDVRSTAGGYVVAPGSTVPGGEYRIEADQPIAPAPEWLVQKLGTSTPRVQREIVDIPDADDAVVERALAFLKTAPPAYEGTGGDAHTYGVACALRDIGVSQAQALELLSGEWNERCEPPWLPEELGVKVRNAYYYGQNPPGNKHVAANKFEASSPAPGTVVPSARAFKARTLKEIARDTRRHPQLVKGYLRKGTFAQIYGAPGEGKTFVALDIAYCVAAGCEWMGCKVKPGPVLYLAYEGSLENRAKALMAKYGEADVPVHVVDATFNLREQAGRQELGAVLADLPAPPVLIVIDTFARAMCGGDENSAQDVGAFTTAVSSLIEATGACVLIIHHSGKNKASGARGSSALLGALDTSIEIDAKQIITDKQREGEAKPVLHFKLEPRDVGVDEDGDKETSCTVEPNTAVQGVSGPLTGKAAHAFGVLSELTGQANMLVSKAAWIAKMIDEGISKSTAHETVRKLKLAGKITVNEQNMVNRRLA